MGVGACLERLLYNAQSLRNRRATRVGIPLVLATVRVCQQLVALISPHFKRLDHCGNQPVFVVGGLCVGRKAPQCLAHLFLNVLRELFAQLDCRLFRAPAA